MKRVRWFLMVGAGAALVHQLTVVLLVETRVLEPAYANVLGFALAWCVSYFGHRKYTFRSSRPHVEAAPRFLIVSVFAFVSNQAIFVGLLRFTALNYAVALFFTLLAVAAGTYLLSSRWAFRAGTARGN